MTKLPCLDLPVTAHSGLPQAGPKDRSGAKGKPEGGRQETLGTKYSTLSISDLGLETTPPSKGSLWFPACLLSLPRPQEHLPGPWHCGSDPWGLEKEREVCRSQSGGPTPDLKELWPTQSSQTKSQTLSCLWPEARGGQRPSAKHLCIFIPQSCNSYYICHSLCADDLKNVRRIGESTRTPHRDQDGLKHYISISHLPVSPFLFISHVAQTWLKLSVQSRMSLNSWSLSPAPRYRNYRHVPPHLASDFPFRELYFYHSRLEAGDVA